MRLSTTVPRRTPHKVHGARVRALLLVAGMVLAAGCGGGGVGREATEPVRVPAVEAVPARVGSLPLQEVLSGVVRAHNQVAVRPEVSGTVVEVLVGNGDAVRAGQALVRLDAETLSEQLHQAEAELQVAEGAAAEATARVAEVRARAVRTRSLAEAGLTSELDLETQEAQLDAEQAAAEQARGRVAQARSTVEERRAALSRATVQAPVAGRVGQRNAEVGMAASPSATLFLIGSFDELIVEVPLTQEMLASVDVGTPVGIETRGGADGPIAATISRISPFLEPTSFSTTAEIDVPGSTSGLRPGMFVRVHVLYGAGVSATLVPASAVWEDPRTGDPTVFLVVDASGLVEPEASGGEIPEVPRQVVQQPVEVLADGGALLGVQGVAEGEWVVTLGQHLLAESLASAADRGHGDVASVPARVRPTSWERVLELEGLQREDLLKRFLAKQRAVARALGAGLPGSTAEVEEALEATGAGSH